VARTRFSPFLVNGMSDVPVCLPESDHSVSPCRTMKQRGVVIFLPAPFLLFVVLFSRLLFFFPGSRMCQKLVDAGQVVRVAG
jgi:hypothetical protein